VGKRDQTMMVMGAIVMTKSKIYSSKYTGLMATAMPGTRQWRVSLEHTAEHRSIVPSPHFTCSFDAVSCFSCQARGVVLLSHIQTR
jgi:hypothetical protein